MSRGPSHSGRRPDPAGRKYQITRVQDWHMECMRLIVLGWTNKEIAKRLGVSEASITAVRNSTITRKQIAVMQAHRDAAVMGLDPESRLTGMIHPAIDVLEGILSSENEAPLSMRRDVALAVLSINGYGPTKKVEGKHAVGIGVFSREDAEELRRRREAAVEEGITLDVGG